LCGAEPTEQSFSVYLLQDVRYLFGAS